METDWTASRVSLFGDKVHKGVALMKARSIDDLYARLVRFPDVDCLLKRDLFDASRDRGPSLSTLMDVQCMMCWDTLQYLLDDILAKVDRAAMAVSLGTRVPLLDHDLVAFTWTLGDDIRLHGGASKWPLRQVLRKYVPDTPIDRRKMGFGVPIADWLRGPLRDWAGDRLSERALQVSDTFVSVPVRTLWDEHQTGRRNWSAQLWTLLMCQAWSQSNARVLQRVA